MIEPRLIGTSTAGVFRMVGSPSTYHVRLWSTAMALRVLSSNSLAGDQRPFWQTQEVFQSGAQPFADVCIWHVLTKWMVHPSTPL